MKRALLIIAILFLPHFSYAEPPGQQGFEAVRHCVMENNVDYCHSVLTPESYPYFDRFVSYKLMPCLPTDFNYVSEESKGVQTTVTAANRQGNINYLLRLVFLQGPNGLKLDLPASFRRGFGENWKDKIQLSEQLYLMMKQNMGDKLTCDTLTSLVQPQPPSQ